eukprot:9907436-Alexandrium_andersonii.AAC.1
MVNALLVAGPSTPIVPWLRACCITTSTLATFDERQKAIMFGALSLRGHSPRHRPPEARPGT